MAPASPWPQRCPSCGKREARFDPPSARVRCGACGWDDRHSRRQATSDFAVDQESTPCE